MKIENWETEVIILDREARGDEDEVRETKPLHCDQPGRDNTARLEGKNFVIYDATLPQPLPELEILVAGGELEPVVHGKEVVYHNPHDQGVHHNTPEHKILCYSSNFTDLPT